MKKEESQSIDFDLFDVRADLGDALQDVERLLVLIESAFSYVQTKILFDDSEEDEQNKIHSLSHSADVAKLLEMASEYGEQAKYALSFIIKDLTEYTEQEIKQ